MSILTTFALTVAQPIKPVLVPISFDIVTQRLQFRSRLADSVSRANKAASVVHDSSVCALKVVANCYQNGTDTGFRAIVPNLVVKVSDDGRAFVL